MPDPFYAEPSIEARSGAPDDNLVVPDHHLFAEPTSRISSLGHLATTTVTAAHRRLRRGMNSM